jgi:hypothetical protein
MPKNPPATIMLTRRAIFFPDIPENNGVSEFESGAYDTNNQTIENLKPLQSVTALQTYAFSATY